MNLKKISARILEEIPEEYKEEFKTSKEVFFDVGFCEADIHEAEEVIKQLRPHFTPNYVVVARYVKKIPHEVYSVARVFEIIATSKKVYLQISLNHPTLMPQTKLIELFELSEFIEILRHS